jgi:hypothetical protein
MVEITAEKTTVDYVFNVGLCYSVVGELISRTLERRINLSDDAFAAASQIPSSTINHNVNGTFNK